MSFLPARTTLGKILYLAESKYVPDFPARTKGVKNRLRELSANSENSSLNLTCAPGKRSMLIPIGIRMRLNRPGTIISGERALAKLPATGPASHGASGEDRRFSHRHFRGLGPRLRSHAESPVRVRAGEPAERASRQERACPVSRQIRRRVPRNHNQRS